MKISVIAAVADNGVIGRAGDLPWHLRSDLKRFKDLTLGHAVIAGRKTHESIVRRLGGPLPGRRTIVLSRQRGYRADGCTVVPSWEEALSAVGHEDEVFVIGGAEIFALALPQADRLYLTRVHATVEGDSVFPDHDRRQWKLARAEFHPRTEQDDYAYTFEILERTPEPHTRGRVSIRSPRPGSPSGARG